MNEEALAHWGGGGATVASNEIKILKNKHRVGNFGRKEGTGVSCNILYSFEIFDYNIMVRSFKAVGCRQIMCSGCMDL
jgi:hypothetical protein